MAALAAAVTVWAAVAVPSVSPLPSKRQTVLGLALRLSHGSFVRPATALAGATAAVAVGVVRLGSPHRVQGGELDVLCSGNSGVLRRRPIQAPTPCPSSFSAAGIARCPWIGGSWG